MKYSEWEECELSGVESGMFVLEIMGLEVWYGEFYILYGVDLMVYCGEVVMLFGCNGVGCMMMLCVIMGFMGCCSGLIKVVGYEMIGFVMYCIVYYGIGYCLEECGIFLSLLCEENLMLLLLIGLCEYVMLFDEIYVMFLNFVLCWQSQGMWLFGGEQQMFVVVWILCIGVNLLLFDEIFEGFVLVIVQVFVWMIVVLKVCGYMIVMVEQNFCFVVLFVDCFYVMEYGSIVEYFCVFELEGKMLMLYDLFGV